MAFKPLSLFNKIILAITCVIAFGVFISMASSYISPKIFWPAWFLAAAFPVLICMLVVLQIYWLVVLRWPVLIPLVVLVICSSKINRLIQFRLPKDNSIHEKGITILSYNVHLFDWFNWKNPWQYRKQILEQVKSTKPDIICFQEYFHRSREGFNTIDTVASQNNLKHFYFEKYPTKKKLPGFGIMIFSRWPIINKGVFVFEHTKGNLAIWADLLTEKDTIRVYNLHIESNRFGHEDYKFLKEINGGNAEMENSRGWRHLVRQLKIAAKSRASQVDTLKTHITKCPYPVIVCGDFNDLPSSYTYNQISNGLKDAFLEKGTGIGQTYIGIAPSFRIDYIMHSPKFETLNFETHPEEYSDHHAISAIIR